MGDARRLLSARGSVLGNGGVFWKRSRDTRKGSSHMLGTCVLWESQAEKHNTKLGPAHWNFWGAHQKQRQNCSGGTLPLSVQHRFFWNLSSLALRLSRWYIFETIPYVQENKYISHSLLFLLGWALSQFGHYLSLCLVYFLQISEVNTDKCVLWVSSKNLFILF